MEHFSISLKSTLRPKNGIINPKIEEFNENEFVYPSATETG